MSYHHEQVGQSFIFIIAAGIVVIVIVALVLKTLRMTRTGIALLLSIAALFAVVTVSFARLNTAVDGSGVQGAVVRWSMTFGWPGGAIPVSEIAEAHIIPLTPWMGIGIHLTRRGWLWNVSLGKGVQIRQHNGSDIVLGTDDPQGLLAAIQRAR